MGSRGILIAARPVFVRSQGEARYRTQQARPGKSGLVLQTVFVLLRQRRLHRVVPGLPVGAEEIHRVRRPTEIGCTERSICNSVCSLSADRIRWRRKFRLVDGSAQDVVQPAGSRVR